MKPDAGVIRDARVRRAQRRNRIAGAVIALLAIGALIAGLLESSNSNRAEHARATLAFQRARQRRQARGWYISPNLTGGGYGWCVMEPVGASCPTVPTENERTSGARVIGTAVGSVGTSHEERITLLLAAGVRGILANERSTQLHTRARLPYGLRIAQIEYPKKTWTEHASTLLATGANGRPLGEINQESAGVEANIRWWEKPERPASGPCQIHAHGLPALQGEWGHVATTISPYPARIIGRAFFSCIDTEYYLHNWPLETSILLDAQYPGAFPAAIPGMKPITGEPELFWAPGDWHGEITATRNGNAWVVVAGGSGLRQREEVLHHLTASVRL